MDDQVVLDASVAWKCFYNENDSKRARVRVDSAAQVIAPDLIYAELTNVAAKRIRRDELTVENARTAIAGLRELIDRLVPPPFLTSRALVTAANYSLSGYDAVYVVLAGLTGARLLTADTKLVKRLAGTNLADVVTLL